MQRKGTAHAPQGFLHDGQAQAGTVGRCACGFATEKRFGQVGNLVRRHAHAVVAYPHKNPLLTRQGRDLNQGDAGIRRLAVLAGVFQQVGNDAAQFHFVGQHLQSLLNVACTISSRGMATSSTVSGRA